MKRTSISVFLFVCSLFWGSCTKDNFIATGISNGRHEGKTLWEYMDMEFSSYDWDSTMVMVRHAGEDMVRLFNGEDPEHPEITFFGITNHSIRRYLLENNYKQVTDLDPEWCRSILLKHIVDGKYYRADFPYGIEGTYGTVSGGITLTTLAGTQICVYIEYHDTGYVVENAAKPINVCFLESNGIYAVASGDIEPDDCVVHALEYAFTIGDEE